MEVELPEYNTKQNQRNTYNKIVHSVICFLYEIPFRIRKFCWFMSVDLQKKHLEKLEHTFF